MGDQNGVSDHKLSYVKTTDPDDGYSCATKVHIRVIESEEISSGSLVSRKMQ